VIKGFGSYTNPDEHMNEALNKVICEGFVKGLSPFVNGRFGSA